MEGTKIAVESYLNVFLDGLENKSGETLPNLGT